MSTDTDFLAEMQAGFSEESLNVEIRTETFSDFLLEDCDAETALREQAAYDKVVDLSRELKYAEIPAEVYADALRFARRRRMVDWKTVKSLKPEKPPKVAKPKAEKKPKTVKPSKEEQVAAMQQKLTFSFKLKTGDK